MSDLATQFSAIKQADAQGRVDYAVARKLLDTQRATGEAAVKLIEAAAEVQAESVGGGTPGLGEQLDTRG